MISGKFLFKAFIVLIFVIISGRIYGHTIDIELRESEGHPSLVKIPEIVKPFFHFRWDAQGEVALCAVYAEVISFLFSIALAIVLCLTFFVSAIHVIMNTLVDFLFITYVVCELIVTVPTSLCCFSSEMVKYDLDIISSIQHSLGILKKRRCRIIAEAEPGVYFICFGLLGKRTHRATSTIPVEIGHRYYAVHFYDNTPYYWIIRDH